RTRNARWLARLSGREHGRGHAGIPHQLSSLQSIDHHLPDRIAPRRIARRRMAGAALGKYERCRWTSEGRVIPLKYNIQNLKARNVSTLMSVFGIGIVIAVMLSMMALYNGVLKATTTSGSKDAMMVMRE